MLEVHVLIPLADNEGQVFPEAHHAQFEAHAISLFGGVTLLPGEARGAWEEAGVVYHDRSRVYSVALGSIVQGGRIADLADYGKRHYRQLALYIRYLGMAEVL